MQHNPYTARPRIPTGVIAVLVIMALIPIIAVLIWLAWQWRTLEVFYPAIADTLRIFLLGSLVSSPALALWAAWRRWAGHEYIKADKVIALANAQRELPSGVQSVTWHDSSRQLPDVADRAPAPEPQVV